MLAGLPVPASADPLRLGPPALDGVSPGLRGEASASGLTPFIFDGTRDWPALRFHMAAPLDWRAAGALAVPVDNPATAPFTLLLRLDDRADANGDDRSLTGIVTVPGQTSATVVLPLAPTPPGLRGRPPAAIRTAASDLVVPDARGAVDLGHIVALHLSGVRTGAPATLLFGPPTLRPAEGAPSSGSPPLADGFGQAIAGRWPEKVENDADLRAKLGAAAVATRRLGAEPSLPVDRWGGWSGLTLRASGFFRTERLGRRWILVTPDGHPFFSLGVDAVRPDNPTVVGGREALFAALPGSGSPLARFYDTATGLRRFDIGRADLQRGLGTDWGTLWPPETITRLKAWGFNTLGNWSDPALAPALPHVTFTDVEGDSAAVPMGDRALVDPFDPAFPAVADRVAAAMTAPFRGDAGLIGYFSGNELPWGEADRPAEGVAAHCLALRPGSPAREALLADLRTRYGTPAALARAWGLPPLAGWTAPIVVPAQPNPAALADLARFEARFADRYFATVAAALHRHDPDHLYLGTRFASWTPAAVAACARHCDALSFNRYGRTPQGESAPWQGLDRPVLIGEFHFGSLDRGSFWPGMSPVPHESDRGPAYRAYLEAAVADPAVVGAHWYQWADEPLTGRPYDGENGHLGLVAVTDVPFAGFVAEVAAANRQAQAWFAKQVARASR